MKFLKKIFKILFHRRHKKIIVYTLDSQLSNLIYSNVDYEEKIEILKNELWNYFPKEQYDICILPGGNITFHA